MRILVAEDERITRTSLVRQLQKLGHEVTAAEDGQRGDGCGRKHAHCARSVDRDCRRERQGD